MALKTSKNVLALMNAVDKLSLEENLKANFLMDDMIKASFGDERIDIADFALEFTLEETETIARKYGSQIKKLQYSCFFDDTTNNKYAEIFAKYCENLEEIHLKGFEIKVDNVFGHILKAKNHLKRLILHDCTLGNASCSLVSRLKLLEILDLEGSTVTGKDFNSLSNLVELNLKECKNFKSEIFVEMCSRNCLKKLNIIGFKCFSDTDLSKFIDKLPKLENLAIGTKSGLQRYERIFKIGTLHEINIKSNNEQLIYKEVMQNYFTVLMQVHKENLQAINIESIQIHFDNKMICCFKNLKALSLRNCVFNYLDLVRIAKSCLKLEMLDLFNASFVESDLIEIAECMPNLRYLDVSHCAAERSFYGRLVETRRVQGFKQPLFVFIDRGMVLAEVLKTEYYRENQNYVKLIVQEMRSHGNTSMLDCLARLNIQYINKTSVIDYCTVNAAPLSQQKLSFFDLNNDCLRKIIQYLSMIEKLILILTSNRFVDICESFFNDPMIDVQTIANTFTLREAREIFAKCGQIMKALALIFSCERSLYYLDLAATYCTNIKVIAFFNGIPQKYEKLVIKLIAKSVNTLRIISTDSSGITEAIEREIAKIPNLENFVADYPLTGKCLNGMKKLKELHIFNSANLSKKYFNNICKSNQLHSLSLRSDEMNPVPSFQILFETQRKLETLSLYQVAEFESVVIASKLRSLTKITFTDCNPEGTVMALGLLSEFRENQIKALVVNFSYELPTMIHTVLLLCISKFPKLLFLELIMRNNLDTEFAKKIFKSCSRLEILSVIKAMKAVDFNFEFGGNSLNKDQLMMSVEILCNLRQLFLGTLDFDQTIEIVSRIKDIKKTRKDTEYLRLIVTNDDCLPFLNTKEYKMMTRYVVVSIVEIWPSPVEFKKEKQNENRLATTCSDRPSLDLPDNCLREIASKLPSIDKLSFAFTNRSILNAMKPIAREIIFDINEISRVFTLCQAKQLFFELRDHIENFSYSISKESDPVEYVKLIQPFSSKFRRVHVFNQVRSRVKDNIGTLFALPEQKLEKLRIEDFDSVNHIVSQIFDKKKSGFNPLENLTELSLFGSRILPSQFNAFCRNCHLKKLDIIDCTLLNDENFTTLLETQNDYLECLRISCEYQGSNFTNVVSLSNLKSISIKLVSYSKVFEMLFAKLIKYHRFDLLTLEIATSLENVFDYSKVNRLLESKRGKFVNLQKFQYGGLLDKSLVCI